MYLHPQYLLLYFVEANEVYRLMFLTQGMAPQPPRLGGTEDAASRMAPPPLGGTPRRGTPEPDEEEAKSPRVSGSVDGGTPRPVALDQEVSEVRRMD